HPTPPVKCPPATTPELLFFVTVRRPQLATLFPYTTLFRSRQQRRAAEQRRQRGRQHGQETQPVDSDPGGALQDRQRARKTAGPRSEEHTSELQSQSNLVCRLLLEKKNEATTQGIGCPRSRS